MRSEHRVKPNMNDTEVLYAMSSGNPGAATVLLCLRAGFSPFNDNTSVVQLDELGIYESRIWMLYKDMCGEDIVATRSILQAASLELLSLDALHHAIDHYGEGVDVAEVIEKLHDHLKGQELCLP